MTVQKYTLSNAHREAVRASGFDIANPDRRHPVRSREAERLLTALTRSRDPRAMALLKDRGDDPDHQIGRGH